MLLKSINLMEPTFFFDEKVNTRMKRRFFLLIGGTKDPLFTHLFLFVYSYKTGDELHNVNTYFSNVHAYFSC